MTYVITGATGNIGHVVVKTLLENGKKVRVVSRSKERVEHFINKGAEAAIGDLTDPGFTRRAFKGATAVFALIPPNPQAEDFRKYQGTVGKNIVDAVKHNKVEYVVNLSSLGAHLTEGTGPVLGLHDQEERFNKLDNVNVVHLRPGFFMENLLMNIALIKEQGVNGTPLKGDVPIPTIATRDIGWVASEYLLDLNFKGKKVRNLMGPQDLTLTELTRIIGKAINKPDLKYVQFPYEDAEKAMLAMGISRDMARQYVELYRGINEGIPYSDTKRTDASATQTTFEDFSTFFAQAYNSN